MLTPQDVPPHPGVYLERLLTEIGIKPSAFALSLGNYPSLVTEIIRGKRTISVATALKLERHLGAPAEFWLMAQMTYDLSIERTR